ncbi:MAG: hypothetical protein AAB445_02190 [Patescibacteria group bacterium]
MLTVRKAIAEDADHIAEILKAKYSFPNIQEAKAIFAYEREYHHFRVALDAGRMVGLISWRQQGTLAHGVAEVTRFAVLKDALDPIQVKELLFDAALAEAENHYERHGSRLRKIFSLIHADNRRLQTFYANKGLHQEAVLKDHFRLGQDELVFSRFFA